MAFTIRPPNNVITSFSPSPSPSSYNQTATKQVVGLSRRTNLRLTRGTLSLACSLERSNSDGGGGVNKKGGSSGISNSNYAVPLDKSFSFSNSSSLITRPLAEILRDLNKRIPDTIVKSNIIPPDSSANSTSTLIPWYHANRMLSFYAPGWCGEIRDVIFSDNGSVTVVYRLTVRGSDGEAYRESTGTISSVDDSISDPVGAAEEVAFCKACARFGLGLYLYHEDQIASI